MGVDLMLPVTAEIGILRISAGKLVYGNVVKRNKQPTLWMKIMSSKGEDRMSIFAGKAESFDEIAMPGLAYQKRGEKTDG